MAFTAADLQAALDPSNTGRTCMVQKMINGPIMNDVYVVGVTAPYAGKSQWVQISAASTAAQAATTVNQVLGVLSVSLSATVPLIAIPTTIGVASLFTTPDAVVSQQWSLDGVDVSGATSPTYIQAFADSAKALRVRDTIASGSSATSLPVLPGVQNLNMRNTINLRAMLAGGVRGMMVELGDSAMSGFLSGGTGETNMRANSYGARLATKLTAAGFPASKDSSFGGGQATTNAAYQTMDPRWVFSATTMNLLSGYPSLGGLMFGLVHTNTTDTAKFTPGTAFDTADIYFAGNTTGGGILNIYGTDGSTLVNTLDTSVLTGLGVKTITFPTGTTSLTIKFGSGAGDPYISGVKTRLAATPKIEIINGALTGQTVLANSTAPGATAAAYVPRAVLGALYDPAIKTVLVLNGWYNDQTSGQTLTQILANYKIICDEAVARGWDMWYVSYPALDPTLALPATIAAFEPAVLAYLRDTYNAVIFQESKVITDYATYNALGYYGDRLHINGTGHEVIANTLLSMCKLAATSGAIQA